jgi:hypothetical protein
MRVLEARFHPRRRGQADFVTLGYLVWRDTRDEERPVFEPARALVPDAVRSKLEYLVGVNEPGSYARLQALRSVYWSFVPIAADEDGASARADYASPAKTGSGRSSPDSENDGKRS